MKRIPGILILLGAILLSLSVAVAEPSSPERELNVLEAYSYDYSDNLYWGFGGLIDDLYRQEADLIDTDYVGLSQVQKQDIREHPVNWLKAWIRIRFPALPQEEDWLKYWSPLWFPGMDGDINFWLDQETEMPVGVLLEKVRIQNADDLGIYCKNIIIVAGNNLVSKEKQITGTGYMEVLIEKRQRNEEEIDAAIRQAQVYAVKPENSTEYTVSMDTCFRETLFSANEMQLYCAGYYPVPINPADFHYGEYSTLPMPADLLTNLQKHPEKYELMKLDLRMDKNMPWGVCSILPKIYREGNNVCFFYVGESDSPVAINDCLENGKGLHLDGFFLLLSRDINEEKREEMIRGLDLELEFSTEFAGEIWWDGETDGKWGYSGPRFVKKIDMSKAECMAVEARAYSYDCASAPGWGIGDIYKEGSEFEEDEPEETQYPRLSYSDLKAHDWLRCWVRLQIEPCIEFVGISGSILSGKAARLTNVRVENANDVRLFPLESLYYSATGAELEVRGVNQNADEWILELLVPTDDTDNLDKRLKNARILFDCVILGDKEFEEGEGTVIEGLPIDMQAVERQEYDPREGLVFCIGGLEEDPDPLTSFIYNSDFDTDSLTQKERDLILTNPDQQVVYNLDVRCTNNSPWPVYGLCAHLREDDRIVLAMLVNGNEGCHNNNVWPGDTEGYFGIRIICEKSIPADEVLRIVSEKIYYTVSTEAVGKVDYYDRIESIIDLGKRFEVGINADSAGEVR